MRVVQSKFNNKIEGNYHLGLRSLEKFFAEEVVIDLALNYWINCYSKCRGRETVCLFGEQNA